MYLYVESRVAVIWWSRDVVAITLELGLVGEMLRAKVEEEEREMSICSGVLCK